MNLVNIHIFTLWPTIFFFYLADKFVHKNDLVRKYKLNPIPATYWYYCHISMLSTLFNQIFLTIPVINFMEYYCSDIQILNWRIELCKFLLYIVLIDPWVYSLHYMLHHIPMLYKLHKFHHRYNNSSAAAALDSHPIDHLVLTLGSVSIGPLLWKGHYITLYMWIAISTFLTTVSHSGFNHPLVCSKEHNIHHRQPKYNYGDVFYIMDRLCGTYKAE